MITSKYVYVIKVKVEQIKEVIEAYNAIDGKGFIQFEPTGLFSGYVNVLYGSLDLVSRLSRTIDCIQLSDIRETYCFPCIGTTENCSTDKKNENDIAFRIKEEVDNLNRLVIEARKEGLVVDLRADSSTMAANTPPLQATVVKVVLVS